MSDPLLIYGANGYTGRLIAEHAAERGLSPVLAGRNRQAVTSLADRLGLESRIFALTDPRQVDAGLEGMACVLHAAGPFSTTARPMLDACLRVGAHYLDITGEIDVFELAASLDGAAREANVMLLPGVGFDVLPSDCLAAYTAEQHRGEAELTHLHIGIVAPGGISQGTTKTMLEAVDRPTRVRRNGKIISRPVGSVRHTFDFGWGPRTAIAVSYGDVATAYYSTGIPNITVYLPARKIAGLLRASHWLGPVLSLGPVQRLLRRAVDLLVEGPDKETLVSGLAIVVAEVEDAAGERASARLQTPNIYRLTVLAAVDIARRVLAGEWTAGFQTPSLAYGAEYVLTLPGCQLTG